MEINTAGTGVFATGAAAEIAAKLTGDVLSFKVAATEFSAGATVLVVTSAADETVFLQNNGTSSATVGFALDSTTGKLYADLDSNGTADSLIQLTGVTTIIAAAFELFAI